MTSQPLDIRRATRDSRSRVLGGVAAGLARHLGVDALWVRVAFVLLAGPGGLGVMLYAAYWLVLPSDVRFENSAPGLEAASRDGRRPGPLRRLGDATPAIVLGVLGLGVVLSVEAVLGRGALIFPLALAGLGVTLLWRQADEAQQERWLDTSGRVDPFRFVVGRGGWASYLRLGAGALLVTIAMGLFALGNGGSLPVVRDVLLAALIGFVGLGVVIGPWLWRLGSDLASERAERVRTQERADLAAHLHDSVLQTLALIQRQAHDPAQVARLARAQERDLRTWLYDEAPATDTTLAGALKTVAAQVEDAHGISVDVVTVGDTAAGPVRALVEATREAVTNAAKHAEVPRVDVYAEVSPSAAEVFVRDRGVGFDPTAVADDRLGLRRSVIDRMQRHGGSAEVRSEPGSGAEIRLRMPLDRTEEP